MRHLLIIVAIAFATTACSPPSGEELVQEVMQQRNKYDATPQSWIVRPDSSIYIEVLVVNNNLEGGLRTLTVLVEQIAADDSVIRSERVPMDVASLTAGLGNNLGVTVMAARPDVEYVRLLVEAAPESDTWSDFPEFDAVRPRI
ncbi:MAG TPA: hypothetical protein QGG47_15145 [Acidobacteriota bacterium]|nr:hypothetical protein [Acidobacteriota bacterium]